MQDKIPFHIAAERRSILLNPTVRLDPAVLDWLRTGRDNIERLDQVGYCTTGHYSAA